MKKPTTPLTSKPAAPPAKNKTLAKVSLPKAMPSKELTAGQQAYEAKRAKKAGMSVERWLASKQRAQENEAREKAKAAELPKPVKPPGLLSRLLDRAHKPLR